MMLDLDELEHIVALVIDLEERSVRGGVHKVQGVVLSPFPETQYLVQLSSIEREHAAVAHQHQVGHARVEQERHVNARENRARMVSQGGPGCTGVDKHWNCDFGYVYEVFERYGFIDMHGRSVRFHRAGDDVRPGCRVAFRLWTSTRGLAATHVDVLDRNCREIGRVTRLSDDGTRGSVDVADGSLEFRARVAGLLVVGRSCSCVVSAASGRRLAHDALPISFDLHLRAGERVQP